MAETSRTTLLQYSWAHLFREEILGLGLLIGDPDGGKTSALRLITDRIKSHRYQVTQRAATALDAWTSRPPARDRHSKPSCRRSHFWRDINARVTGRATCKQGPGPIIDERRTYP